MGARPAGDARLRGARVLLRRQSLSACRRVPVLAFVEDLRYSVGMFGSIAAVGGGALLLLLGFLGCIVPAIPGPVLAYLSLILVSLAGSWTVLSPLVLVITGILAIAATVLDNVFPALASKQAGAGRAGVWGSVVGMIAGSILLPPLGVFIGAFVGALLGEVVFNPDNREPMKAALGVFRGTLLGILVKLSVTGLVAFYFVRASFRLFL